MKPTHIKIALSFLFILQILTSASGQTDFRPGYVITNEMDTLHGFIDYRGDTRNCKVCVFKSGLQSEPVYYLPGKIFAYRFTGSKYYISKELKKDSVSTPVFVEFLVDGIMDLFYYVDDKRPYYLIEDTNHTIYELDIVKRKSFEDDGAKVIIHSYKKYIGILRMIFKDCPQLYQEIDKASLTHKSLSGVTKKYHDYVCNDEQCILYTKNTPYIKLDLSISAGLKNSGISISDNRYYLGKFGRSTQPSLGISTNICFTELNEKISLELCSGISKSRFYCFNQPGQEFSFRSFEIESFPVDFTAGIKYSYPKGRFRPFICMGGEMVYLAKLRATARVESISATTVNTYVTYYSDFPKDLYGFFGSMGLNCFVNQKKFGWVRLDYKINSHENNIPNLTLKTVDLSFGIFIF